MTKRSSADEWEAQALFFDSGLSIEALREPRPSEGDVEAVPRLAKSRLHPAFLHLRCVW